MNKIKISKLIPSGFCYGVDLCFNETKKILATNSNKKIYMLGWIVHNKNVINDLINQGLILLDDTNLDRYELVKKLAYSNDNDFLILSAHGTCNEAIELAKKKNYQVIDLTCPFVYKTHKLIIKKLKENKAVYFIGKKNHPETKAIIKINDAIKLITDLDDINKYDFNEKEIFITNQTTLSIYEIQHLIDAIKLKNENVEFVNDICNATTIRQKALKEYDSIVDIIIILGDQKSSNSKELFKIAKQKCDSYLISNKNDINQEWFNNKKHCLIVSAASCPETIVDETFLYLDSILNNN